MATKKWLCDGYHVITAMHWTDGHCVMATMWCLGCADHTILVWCPMSEDQLSYIHCLIVAVSLSLCYGHCLMTIMWWLLNESHSVRPTVLHYFHNGHCVMAILFCPLCDDNHVMTTGWCSLFLCYCVKAMVLWPVCDGQCVMITEYWS